MKFSMTGQKKGDLLIQATAWVGLTHCILGLKLTKMKIILTYSVRWNLEISKHEKHVT